MIHRYGIILLGRRIDREYHHIRLLVRLRVEHSILLVIFPLPKMLVKYTYIIKILE